MYVYSYYSFPNDYRKDFIIVISDKIPDINPMIHNTAAKLIQRIILLSLNFLSVDLRYKNTGKKNAIITTQNPPNNVINSEISE